MEGDRRSFSFALLAGEVGKRLYLFDAHARNTGVWNVSIFERQTAWMKGDTMQVKYTDRILHPVLHP